VKAFNIFRGMATAVGREVVSLGIPQHVLKKYFDLERLTKINVWGIKNNALVVIEKHLLITGYFFQEEEYQQWLESLPYKQI
jgi:hypothetical protein